MEKIYLILLVALVISPAFAQKKKKPKVYKNKTFEISIPVGWKKYDDLVEDQNVLFTIAPKKEIDQGFHIVSKNDTQVINELEQHAGVQSNHNKMSLTKIDLSEEVLNHKNLSLYMEARANRFANRSGKHPDESRTVYQQSEEHFVEILKLKTVGKEEPMYHLMHLRAHKGKLYMLIFSAPKSKVTTYLEDVTMAFESFKFL